MRTTRAPQPRTICSISANDSRAPARKSPSIGCAYSRPDRLMPRSATGVPSAVTIRFPAVVNHESDAILVYDHYHGSSARGVTPDGRGTDWYAPTPVFTPQTEGAPRRGHAVAQGWPARDGAGQPSGLRYGYRSTMMSTRPGLPGSP